MTESKIKKELVVSIVTITLMILLGVIVCFGVALGMFLYWYYCTKSDVIQLFGYYFIFGTMIDLCIISFVGESISKYWKKTLRRLKIRIKIMNRRKRDEELDESLLIFSKCKV